MTERGNGWKVELLDTLTRNPWFGVLLQKVTQPDGSSAPYYTIDFPNRAVGVVVRRGKLLHPDEDTKLEVGDRVIVFSATASESEVRKALFG